MSLTHVNQQRQHSLLFPSRAAVDPLKVSLTFSLILMARSFLYAMTWVRSFIFQLSLVLRFIFIWLVGDQVTGTEHADVALRISLDALGKIKGLLGHAKDEIEALVANPVKSVFYLNGRLLDAHAIAQIVAVLTVVCHTPDLFTGILENLPSL